MIRRRTIAVLGVLVIPSLGPSFASAAKVNNEPYLFQSTITTDADGWLDLRAELHYDDAATGSPIAVVMHSYSTPRGAERVRTQAQRLRDKGFFTIAVSLRGRGGSDGVRDSGGLEIHDILDALEAVKRDSAFESLIDPTNLHITGYSGGGGNAMSALTKFPDTFRAGSAFFGMSDYGYDAASGWYNNGAGHRTFQLDTDIGDRNSNSGDLAVLDRYHARASNLASKNNPYSEIHLFVDSNETISPPVNSLSYRDNAVAAQSFPGEFDNITVHLGDPTGDTYEDFDRSGANDPDERQRWPHGLPDANRQAAAEQWYLDRLLDGSIEEPSLNPSDGLFVAGFVVTKPFSIFLGSGEDTAGELTYRLSEHEKSFTLDIVSSDKKKTGVLTVNTADMAGREVSASINGEVLEEFIADETYQYDALGAGETLLLTLTTPAGTSGDYNADGIVDAGDYTVWRDGGSPDSSLAGYDLWKTNYGAAPSESRVVPEPRAACLLAIGILVSLRRPLCRWTRTK